MSAEPPLAPDSRRRRLHGEALRRSASKGAGIDRRC
jgi:hypothetical protein